MKTVKTKISDTKLDWVKIRCESVIEMEKDTITLLEWIEGLNEKPNSPVTEDAYNAIDRLSSQLESFRRL